MKMAKIFLAGCNFSFSANAHIKPFVGEKVQSFFLALFFHFPLFSIFSIVSQLIVFLIKLWLNIFNPERRKFYLERVAS